MTIESGVFSCAGRLLRRSAFGAELAEGRGFSPEALIADRRYGFISGACQEAVRSTVEARHSMSDRIDKWVINRWLGIPIFAVLMLVVFQLTFTLEAESNSDLARKLKLDQSYIARTIRLTSLAPDLVEAILDGQEPDGISLRSLRRDLPLEWDEQRRMLSAR